MLLKDWMIIFVIIGLVAFSIGGFYYELNREYNNSTTNIPLIDKYGESLNKSQTSVGSLYNQTAGGEISAGGITGVLFSGIGSFLQIIVQTITTPISLITMTAEQFGIPQQISLAIILILIIAIVFAVIAAILRRPI